MKCLLSVDAALYSSAHEDRPIYKYRLKKKKNSLRVHDDLRRYRVRYFLGDTENCKRFDAQSKVYFGRMDGRARASGTKVKIKTRDRGGVSYGGRTRTHIINASGSPYRGTDNVTIRYNILLYGHRLMCIYIYIYRPIELSRTGDYQLYPEISTSFISILMRFSVVVTEPRTINNVVYDIFNQIIILGTGFFIFLD